MKITLAIVAKAPLPGFAKTRLARTVGDEAAAAVAEQLLRHTLQTAVSTGLTVTLYGTPTQSPLLCELTEQAGVRLRDQVEGDLGARIAVLVTQELSQNDGVLVMGSDCPALTLERLQLAALQLCHHDAVIYPALDGGYTLIGLKQSPPDFFHEMPWSTAEVLPVTLGRMQRLGWQVWQGPALADIDSYEDLNYLPQDWPRPRALVEQAE